jgi:glycosyltransferase involved in cell wall biosynthesis
MKKKRVFIMGGDRGGWALDTEARLASASLSRIPALEIVESLVSADIVHTVWPEQLIEDHGCESVLRGNRPIVASFSNDPWALFERVPGLYGCARGWHCVAQSSKALRQLKGLGIANARQVHYAADFEKFPVRERNFEEARATRKSLGIPESAYLVSSFQRDTEGADLSRIKAQKGPDLFCSVLFEVQKRQGEGSVHVLLAGPRRHWIRRELRRLGIPFTFVGQETEADDYPWQNLPLARIAELLAASDLNLVTSRWEGAPRSLMECAALGVPVLSTPEGIAEDLLEPASIFRSLPEAVEKIAADMRGKSLGSTVEPQRARLLRDHSVEAISAQWAEIYAGVEVNPRTERSFLRDYPVHHPKLHRWIRRANTLKMIWKDSTRASRDDAALHRFTLYPSVWEWRRSVETGHLPRMAAVVRPEHPARSPDREKAVPGDALVLFHSGKGQEQDAALAREWQPRFPGEKFSAYDPALLSNAKLLVTLSDNAAIAELSVLHLVPLVFLEHEAIKETAGFGGLGASDSEAGLLQAIERALAYLPSLRSCLYLPSKRDRGAIVAKLEQFADREIFA